MKTPNHKTPRENKGGKLFDISLSNVTPKGKGNKSKNKLIGLHQTKKLLHSEGNQPKIKRQST